MLPVNSSVFASHNDSNGSCEQIQMQISLSLEKSIFVNMVSSNGNELEVFLMNKIFTQCFGTLKFSTLSQSTSPPQNDESESFRDKNLNKVDQKEPNVIYPEIQPGVFDSYSKLRKKKSRRNVLDDTAKTDCSESILSNEDYNSSKINTEMFPNHEEHVPVKREIDNESCNKNIELFLNNLLAQSDYTLNASDNNDNVINSGDVDVPPNADAYSSSNLNVSPEDYSASNEKKMRQYGYSRSSTYGERHGDRHFKCSHCNYRARLKVHLRSHFLYKHTDDRPFRCQQCMASFKFRTDLRKHMRTHPGAMPKLPLDGVQLSLLLSQNRTNENNEPFTNPSDSLQSANVTSQIT